MQYMLINQLLNANTSVRFKPLIQTPTLSVVFENFRRQIEPILNFLM